MTRCRRRLMAALVLALASPFALAQQVLAWGNNDYEQLNIPSFVGKTVIAVASGSFHNLALTSDGSVEGWGDNGCCQVDVPPEAKSGVVAIDAGWYHSIALKTGGKVLAWGDDDLDQTNVPAAALSGVTAISAGSFHNLALKDGGVLGWGDGSAGQLDIPTEAQSGIVAISGGHFFSLALTSAGEVLAWGDNVSQQTDVPASALSDVVAIAAGGYHALALRSDGSVVAWGDDAEGQTDVPLAARSGVVAIAAGYWHSLAVKADGSVVAWGGDGEGQDIVPATAQSGVLGIGAGYEHSIALRAEAWATLAPSTVWSGDASVGTVHLADAAPTGGVTVGLVSDDAGVHVPSTVTVSEGATTATFPVTTDLSFSPDRTARIRTATGGETVPARILVKGYTASVAFDHPDITGGSTTPLMLKVRLGSALASDVQFDVSSTGPLTGVPATVTVPAGTLEAKVPVSTSPVASPQTATAALSYGGSPVGTAALVVKPITGTLRFAADRVDSGASTTGTVYLTVATLAPVTVQLASGDPDVTVPDSVTVPAGQRTADFPVSTALRFRTADVPIAATVGSVSFSKDLRVMAATSVKSLTGPTAMYGGSETTFTLTLSRAAGPGGYTVTLATFGTPLSAEPSVTVPEGATSVTFKATADDVSALTSGVVAAMGPVNGVPTSVSIRPNVPAEFTLSASTVASGGSVTGTVTLKAVVAVDTVVQLSSSDPVVTAPPTVTVLAGSKTATFTVTAGTTTTSKNVKVTATKHGVNLAKGIKVLP